jgi:hypothetical protein
MKRRTQRRAVCWVLSDCSSTAMQAGIHVVHLFTAACFVQDLCDHRGEKWWRQGGMIHSHAISIVVPAISGTHCPMSLIIHSRHSMALPQSRALSDQKLEYIMTRQLQLRRRVQPRGFSAFLGWLSLNMSQVPAAQPHDLHSSFSHTAVSDFSS